MSVYCTTSVMRERTGLLKRKFQVVLFAACDLTVRWPLPTGACSFRWHSSLFSLQRQRIMIQFCFAGFLWIAEGEELKRSYSGMR